MSLLVPNVDTDFDFSRQPQEFNEFSLDIETTGLDPMQGYRIRLIQVYVPQIDKVAVIDLWNPTEEQLIWLTNFLECFDDPGITWYLQNSMFDLYWFYCFWGVIPKGQIIDSMLLSQISKAGLNNGFRSVKVFAPSNLERLCIEYNIYHDKSLQSSDWSNPNLSPDQFLYAARDPVVTHIVACKIYVEIKPLLPDLVDRILGAIPAFVLLQYSGVLADYSTLENLVNSYNEITDLEAVRLSDLMPYDPGYHVKVLERQNELKQLQASGVKTRKQPFTDKPFNVNSSPQLLHYLVNVLGIPEEKLQVDSSDDEETKLTAAKNRLFEVSNEYKEYTQLEEITRFKSLKHGTGILTGYLDKYDPVRKCVRTSYNLLASQGTGRSSSGSKGMGAINCQNVSNFLPSHQHFNLQPIRTLCQPREGYVLAEFDLDASHFQFARYLSQDKSMAESYNSGLKIHYYTLSSVLALEGKRYTPEECALLVEGKLDPANQYYYKKLYKLCKNVIYSFLNFSGARTLQETYFKAETYVMLEDCRNYLQACADRFVGLREFQLKVYNNALRTKQSIYSKDGLYLGQHVLIVPVDQRLIYIRCNQERTDYRGVKTLTPKISDVIAPHWLSPEGSVMFETLTQVADFQLSGKADFRLVNFSHDSFMVECKKSHIDQVLPYCFDTLNNNMRVYVQDYVPENLDPIACIKKESWHK